MTQDLVFLHKTPLVFGLDYLENPEDYEAREVEEDHLENRNIQCEEYRSNRYEKESLIVDRRKKAFCEKYHYRQREDITSFEPRRVPTHKHSHPE